MPAERRDIRNTAVLVTGAGAGIGAAISTLLLEAGARVVLADMDVERAASVASPFPREQWIACTVDVRSSATLGAAVQAAVDAWGGLDSLVCNAGVGVFGSVLDYPDDRLQAIVDTNLMGTVFAVRAAVSHFDSRPGGGDVVIIASTAGLGTGLATEAVYAASKHGQVGFAISLDREVRERGIRVSTIAPAAVNTGFADGDGRVAGDPAKLAFMQPEDVAFAAVTVLQQPRRMRTALWTLWSMSEGA